MKQITQNYKTGDISLKDLPVPSCPSGMVLVQTQCSLMSIGTERNNIELAKKNIFQKALSRPDLVKRVLDKAKREGILQVYQEVQQRLDAPLPLGYSCSGIVKKVGANVTEFSVGDRVACIGQGFASHAEWNQIPVNLCAHIPEGVSFEEAAYGNLGCIALHGVRLCSPEIGQKVVVVGLGLIGQLAVMLFHAAGVRVFAVDISQKKVSLAIQLGAEGGACGSLDQIETLVQEFTNGVGMDSVYLAVASKDRSPLDLAVRLAKFRGKIVLVGVCDIVFDRKSLWEKELDFKVSFASGPGSLDPTYELGGMDYPRDYVPWTPKRNLAVFLHFVRQKKVNVNALTTHRYPLEEAEQVYARLFEGGENYIGVLLENRSQDNEIEKQVVASRPRQSVLEKVGIGVIGAGLFAGASFLPHFRKIRDVNLVGIASSRGLSGDHLSHKFGFQYCTTDYKELLREPSISTIFILTRHHLHAQMILEAFCARKNVFVEKPMVVSREQLREVMHAYYSIPAVERPRFAVGYNRRFSKYTHAARQFFSGNAPLLVQIRANVGSISSDHWAHQMDEGGGRLLGEGCHFVDLAMALTGEKPKRVFANLLTGAAGRGMGDSAVITLHLQNGSVATITYAGDGDRSFSRERVEMFGQNSIVLIEDWKKIEFVRGGRKKIEKSAQSQFGYREEIESFILTIKNGEDGVSFEEFCLSTHATFRVLDSIQSGNVEMCDIGWGTVPPIV